MDKQTLNVLIDEYIRTHYVPDDDFDDDDDFQRSGGIIRSLIDSILINVAGKFAVIKNSQKSQTASAQENLRGREPPLIGAAFGYLGNSRLNFAIDKKLEAKGESFSVMLSRFIKENGKKKL